MKHILIASLFSLAAAPVLATTPSFNDFPKQGQLEAGRPGMVSIAPSFNDQAGLREQGQLEAGRAVMVLTAPSFNDQPDLAGPRVAGRLRVAGLAGRAVMELAQSQNVIWTPAF